MRKLIFSILIAVALHLNAQTWNSVGGGFNLPFFQCYDLVKHDSKLFAATRTGSHIWNGISWSYVFSGLNWTLSLDAYNDSVYMSGDFYNSNMGYTNVLKFDGANWNPAGGVFNQSSPHFCSVKTILTHNNKLFAGGQFDDNAGTPMKNIAYYNGIKWDSLGKGLNGMVTNLASHNGSLIASGFFSASASNQSIKYIASWNGSTWNPISPNYTFTAPTGGPAFSFNNKLVIGNIWDTINNIPMKGITSWDGINFSSMGHVNIESINSFWVFNNQLFMSGIYSGANAVLRWNGTIWEQIGGNFDNTVFALEDYGGELFAGGRFSTCDGITMNGIARTAIPVATREYDNLKGLSYFPNPTHTNLSISFDDSLTVTIANSLGQQIKSFNFGSGTNNISLNDFQSGIYFIKFVSGNHTQIEKLVVD